MLNIVAFNTANYDDHPYWDVRLPLLVEAIVQADADVIGLSEIRYNPNNAFNSTCSEFWSRHGLDLPNCSTMDTGMQILTLLKTYPGYADAQIVTNQAMRYSNNIWEGLSMISRLPIKRNSFINLSRPPSCTDDNKRITQMAELELASGSSLYFFNTHFALIQPGNQSCLVANVQDTLAMMKACLNDMCCLAGDMNAPPKTPGLKPLASAGLVDTWAQANPGQDGYTWNSSGPTVRIDYCWASRPMALALNAVSLIGTQRNTSGVYASDHRGVLATFDIS